MEEPGEGMAAGEVRGEKDPKQKGPEFLLSLFGHIVVIWVQHHLLQKDFKIMLVEGRAPEARQLGLLFSSTRGC